MRNCNNMEYEITDNNPEAFFKKSRTNFKHNENTIYIGLQKQKCLFMYLTKLNKDLSQESISLVKNNTKS